MSVTTPMDGSQAVAPSFGMGDGGSAALVAPPVGCPNTYTATRFEYAKNGETVTYVMGEQWCWDGDPAACPTYYTVTYAREFRYDGARARYMNRKLSANLLADLGTTWSDYDGDEIYGDFTVANGVPTPTNSYEPGTWRKVGGVSDYLHGDMLGTTRLMSNPSGASIEPAIYTAFGERISGPTVTDSTRYGYVGAWGYQSTPIPESLTPDPFPFLHVGARYYDPSSGRFLQRDPIGIAGGPNVYAYVNGQEKRGRESLIDVN